MRRKQNLLFRLLLLVALASMVLLVACSDDDDDDDNPAGPGGGGGGGGGGDTAPVVTQEMEGIWQYETSFTDCNTGEVDPEMSDAGTDTICVGEDIYGEFDDQVTDCETTILGDTSFRLECSGSETLFDCTVTYATTMTVTYGATSITAVGQLTTTFEGAGCEGAEDQCLDFTTTATRIAAAPAGACDGKAVAATVLQRWLREGSAARR